MTNSTLFKSDVAERVMMLSMINKQIAELNRIKLDVEARIVELVQHPNQGQKTYQVDTYKVQIRSGFNYTVNKKVYLDLRESEQIPPDLNPVNAIVKYEVDKKMLHEIESRNDFCDLSLIKRFIVMTPKKTNISIQVGD